jgi:hypothetical protein
MTSRDPLTHQVMKRTGHTDLDRVTLHWVLTAFQLQKFRARRRTRPTRRKSRAKDVGDFDQFGVGTDRTGLAGPSSDVASSAQQLGVSVTDVFVTQRAGGEFGQERVTDETELNDRPIGSARTESLIHYRRLYLPEFN